MSEEFIEVKQKLIDMYNFNESIQVELTPCGVKPILDYIDSKDKEINKLTAESTEWESKFYDLQKENEKLKERCDYLQRSCDRKEEQRDDARMEYMEQEDYKSRCEKADEKLNKLDFDNFVYSKTALKDIKKNLQNILNGGDEK